MKKVISWLLVITMTAALAIGGTLAYLADTDEDVNVMSVGQVKIDQLEYEREKPETTGDDAVVQEFHDNKPLYPAVTDDNFEWKTTNGIVDWGQIGKDGYESGIWNPEDINNEVDKMVFVKNKGDYDAYVRTVFAFEAGNYTTLSEFQSKVHLNLNETDWTWEWPQAPVTIGEGSYFVVTATYNYVLKPGALTEISLSQVALDPSATNADVAGFGDTYQILVQSQAVQADGFALPDVALNEAFGTIPDEYPFAGDAATKGTDVYTAVNYLEGGTQQITKQVSNIVFGLNADYPEVLDSYKGTLVDVEQDVPVYAYYVPNGGNYDVYLLASDTIYAPTDCSNLCNGMSNLVSFDTYNLDFSRTTSMYRMLRDCGKLADIDVSDWNTANVTNTRDLFRGCKAITALDVSKWDVSKVDTMLAMFQDCVLLETLDVSAWNTGNVTVMTQMFNRCNKINGLDVSNWDTGKVTSFYLMFSMCHELTYLDVSEWDTGNVQTMGFMFYGNQNMGDMKIQDLDVSNWDTSSCTAMEAMFYSCGELTSLDLSKWDVSNVTVMSHMFADCFKLETLNLHGWDTSSLVVMDALFNDCRSLTTLDVSTFKTHNVQEFSQVFEACTSLTEIIGLENWDTSKGYVFDEMFNGARSLKSLNLSSFDTRGIQHGKKMYSNDWVKGFMSTFSGMSSLESITLGELFSFDGGGDVPEQYWAKLPSPASVAGADGKWYNAATGEGLLPAEIPEETAATYVAVKPVNP